MCLDKYESHPTDIKTYVNSKCKEVKELWLASRKQIRTLYLWYAQYETIFVVCLPFFSKQCNCKLDNIDNIIINWKNRSTYGSSTYKSQMTNSAFLAYVRGTKTKNRFCKQTTQITHLHTIPCPRSTHCMVISGTLATLSTRTMNLLTDDTNLQFMPIKQVEIAY